MSVSGTYELEKNENLESFLKTLGLKEDKIEKISSAKPTAIYKLSANKLEVTTKAEETTHNVITLGSPSPYNLASGFELEVNLTLRGTSGKGTLKRGNHSGQISLDFTDTHLTVTFSAGGNSCKRIYRRT